MHDSLFSRQDIALFTAILMFAMAVGGTFTGKLPGRFGESASRSVNPGEYWLTLAGYYLTGIGFVAYYLYKAHRF